MARENAERLGVAERVAFVESDLFAAVPAEQTFDYVASNPPYVTETEYEALPSDVRQHEPRGALVAGPSGLSVIERLLPQAAEQLRPGGSVLLEISPMLQQSVEALIAADARWELGETGKDLAGRPRVVQARRIAS